jgi:hypothetical protein
MSLDDYLAGTRDHYAAYHHHKEQMAYLATGLYLAAMTAIAVKRLEIWQPAASKELLTTLVLVLALIAFSFVIWQLRNREFAADVVRACNDLLTLSLASQLSSPDLTPQNHLDHELPAVLVSRLDEIRRNRRFLDGSRFAEYITYLVMAGWVIGTLLRVHAA